MPVSASKLVTLAQLQAQAERVKQEPAKYTLASELGSLAKKSEISEADLSAALKAIIDGKNNSEAGKQYRAYKLIHGIFEIVGSAEVDLTSYATRESVAKADDDLIKGIYNNMTASSEKYLGSGNLLLFWTLLKSLLNGHESSINDLLARVKLLELILSADVTGNPYYVTFNTLTDVVVSSGIWNESDGRIEF